MLVELPQPADMAKLPGAIVVGFHEAMDNLERFAVQVELSEATIEQLESAIELQEEEVERTAHGLAELRALLKLRLSKGAGPHDPAYVDGEVVFS